MKIKILAILESESNQEDIEDKYNIVDIKVENSKNEIILIEIQYGRELDYMQRMLYEFETEGKIEFARNLLDVLNGYRNNSSKKWLKYGRCKKITREKIKVNW